MTPRYSVVSPCVMATSAVNSRGPLSQLFMQGAVLPDDVPSEQLDHFVKMGMVVPLDPLPDESSAA